MGPGWESAPLSQASWWPTGSENLGEPSRAASEGTQNMQLGAQSPSGSCLINSPRRAQVGLELQELMVSQESDGIGWNASFAPFAKCELGAGGWGVCRPW